MFLGQILAKNAKNDPKTLNEVSKLVKIYNLEITVRSLNETV